jgi:hypothetical protein
MNRIQMEGHDKEYKAKTKEALCRRLHQENMLEEEVSQQEYCKSKPGIADLNASINQNLT